MINRRGVVIGIGLTAAGLPVPSQAELDRNGLAKLAEERQLFFGSSVRTSSLSTDRDYDRTLDGECDLIVCAEMHWRLLSPAPGITSFDAPEKTLNWATARHKKLRGHTLIWHGQTPTWFTEITGRDAAVRALEEHVRLLCSHFAGRIHSWDVVNEPIQGGGLRKNIFLDKIGPEYIEIAFGVAREADPNALLVLNEFHLEYEDPDHRRRRQALLNVVDTLLKRKAPLDVIGLQSHLLAGPGAKFDQKLFSGFLQELADRKLRIMITELDVTDRDLPGEVSIRDQLVADLYERYLDVVLGNTSTLGVITWGITDRDSYPGGFLTRGDKPNIPRPDGLRPRPLLFDINYERKPAYWAVARALRNAPNR